MTLRFSTPKKTKSHPITFETESELNELISHIMTDINEAASKIPAIQPYLDSVQECYDMFRDVYRKNVHLLETVSSFNTTIVMNATKVQIISRTIAQEATSLSKLKSDYDDASRLVTLAHDSEVRQKRSWQHYIQNF
jgi:hypothetical protein